MRGQIAGDADTQIGKEHHVEAHAPRPSAPQPKRIMARSGFLGLFDFFGARFDTELELREMVAVIEAQFASPIKRRVSRRALRRYRK